MANAGIKTNAGGTQGVLTFGGSDVLTWDGSGNVTGVASINGGQLAGLRNRIINGGMQVAQRGTTFTNALNTYTLDRWRVFGGPATVSVSKIQQTGFTSGYNLRFGRPVSDTGTNAFGITYGLETKDSLGLAGKTVTFSFKGIRGGNFSGASNQFSFYIMYGTGTDQTPMAMTGQTAVASQSTTIQNTITSYSVSGAVPSNATQVCVQITYTPTGTAGANDWIDIGDVQLEIGSTATPFEQRPYGMELALCQRYYYRTNSVAANDTLGVGYVANATTATSTYPFPVTMRIAPTALEQSGTAADYAVGYAATSAVCSSVPTLDTTTSQNAYGVVATTAAVLTAGQGCHFRSATSAGYLGFPAEL